MEQFEIIDRNLVMLESMVRTISCSPDDTTLDTFQGTLWAMEEKLTEVKAATKKLRRPLLNN